MINLILRLNDVLVEPFIRKTKKQVCTLLPKNRNGLLLELCCSSGEQSKFACEYGYKVIGLDLNYYAVRYAKRKYPEIKFICADASKTPFKKETFSYLIITNGIHDKTETMQKSIFEEVCQILRPDGFLAVTDLERPWDRRSSIQIIVTYIIEIFSGHCKNGLNFLSRGGISSFIKDFKMEIIKTRKYANRNLMSLICRKI